MYEGETMEKLQQLKEVLKTYQKVAIAYSGGCDSNFFISSCRRGFRKGKCFSSIM